MIILQQQTTSENYSVARALVHVATFLREWIAVLSSRTERESDKRRILAYALSRLLSLCCRFGTADALLLLLLLMLLRLEWSYFFCAAVRVPGSFSFNYSYYCCGNSTDSCSFFSSLDVGKLNFGTSLCARYVSGPACVHAEGGRRPTCDTHSLLLPLAAAGSSSCRWWAASAEAAACFKQLYKSFFCVLYNMICSVWFDIIPCAKSQLPIGFSSYLLVLLWRIYSSVYEDLVTTAVLVYDKFERIERTYGTLAIYTLKE